MKKFTTTLLFFLALLLTSCGLSDREQLKMEKTLMEIRDEDSFSYGARHYSTRIMSQLQGDPKWQDHHLKIELQNLSLDLARLAKSADNLRKGEPKEREFERLKSRVRKEAAHALEVFRR